MPLDEAKSSSEEIKPVASAVIELRLSESIRSQSLSINTYMISKIS